MKDPVPASVLWAALGVTAALAVLSPAANSSPVRVAVLGLGGLAVLPLLGWLRVMSFVPVAAAGLAAAAAAWLLGNGQAVPIAFLAASAVGAAVAAAVTALWPRRPAAGPGLVSVVAALVVWGVVLPRVVVAPGVSPVLFGIDVSTPRSLAVLGVGLLAAAAVGLGNVARSAAGREIAAVGAAAELAERSGASRSAARVRAGLLAGLFSGWAGLLLVLTAGALPPPTRFSPGTAVVWLAVAVVGGVGSIGGTTFAALLIGGIAPLVGVAEPAAAGLGLVAVAVAGGRGLADLTRPRAARDEVPSG